MKTTIYILTILLFSCGQNIEKTNIILQNNFSIPYILDSIETPENIYKTSEMQVPINDIIYIGDVSDTINLNTYDRYNYHNYLDFQGYGDSSIVKHELKLYISNRQLLTIDLENFSIPPSPTNCREY